MIDIDQSDPEIVTVTPHGALGQSDFAALAEAVDGRANETDRVPNLVIRLDRLPHWDSIGALTRHFHFVRDHHRIVAKVAVVGDSPLLSVMPEIADHLVQAKVRRFPAAKLDQAKAWARAGEDDPGRFEEIPGLAADVLGIRAVGIITKEDYAETLIPLVEARLKVHDKLKCLIVIDDDYAAWSGDAAWIDTKFGLSHVRDFSKVAFVTDVGWMSKAAGLFAPLLPYEFKAFPLAEFDQAKAWIEG